MLTNPQSASRGQSSHGTIQHVRHSFLLVSYSNLFVPKTRHFSDIRLQKMS